MTSTEKFKNKQMKVKSKPDGLLDCKWVGGCMILSIRKKEITRIETNEQTER